MALDGTFLLAVKQELEPLIGGRIEKVYQPSKEEIVIGIRTRTGSFKLLISANAASARIHITSGQIENPKVPPMFCMLLRKHLGSGKLLSVRQDGLERILFLDFETVNELGDVVTITLACEIMGKYSNLIVINKDGKIIDSLKRVDDAMSRERLILPAMTYTPPPREDRLNFLIAEEDKMLCRIKQCKGQSLAKALIGVFEGISPVLAREWLFRACGGDISDEELTDEKAQDIVKEIVSVRNDFFEGKRKYTLITDKDGMLKDFCFTDIKQYGSLMETKSCESACETLDRFYSERDRAARMKQRYQDMFRLLSNTYDRILRRTENQRRELKISEERDLLKLKGDLISAHLYELKKGMKEFTCENFYDENCGEITVELDPMLTPSQNMQKYYGGYRKADTAEKRLKVQISQGETELEYISSVSDALSRAVTENDVNELRAELTEQGYLKEKRAGKQKPVKPAPPIEFTSPEGFTILVGRNNKQNDLLTLKTAEKTDIWLHTKDITGSHVIIRARGETVPDETIYYAARIAAAHSSAKNSAQVPVDYVPVKFVKKPAGAKPGMVIFTNNRTLYVKPVDITPDK